LSFCGPVLLIDRDRCRHLPFDETYRGYFFDLDLGLRVWESGLRVVCTPAATVRSLAGRLLPYGFSLDEDLFEEDRRAFVARWTATGRFRRLEREVWAHVPELRRVLELGALDEVRPYPILEYALLERAGSLRGRGVAAEAPPRLQRVASAALSSLERARACVRARGCRGLAGAVARRLLGVLQAARQGRTAPPRMPPPNPTRDARRSLLVTR
jgi:hypothetical protein